MKYMGSKRRISKHILPIILEGRRGGQFYVEPFVGGANMIEGVSGSRMAGDANKHLIHFYNALKVGYRPPKDISEYEFKYIKNNTLHFPPYLLGYYGFALTFNAMWFGSYARNGRGDRYDHQGYNSICTQAPKIQDVTFIHSEYQNLFIPPDSIIYCDPPLRGHGRVQGRGIGLQPSTLLGVV